MNELRSLLLLELRSLYGINRFLHTKDQKAKRRYRALSVAWGLLIIVVFGYVGGLAYGLCALGLAEIVPAYLVSLAGLLVLAFGLFTAGNRIFGLRGLDLLSSMPIKPGSIVLSRFLTMYVEDLLLTFAIMLPGMLVYGLLQRPQLGVYLISLAGAILAPAIPLAISVFLGTLVTAVSSKMRRKSIAQSVLMVLLVIGIWLGSFRLGNTVEHLTPEAFAQLAKSVGDLLANIYPPAMWLNSAVTQMRMTGLIRFVLVSLAVAAVLVCILSRAFYSISWRLQSFSAKHSYQIGEMQSSGLLKALYFREAKRYFSSSIYVTNTIIGPILGTILSVTLCITGVDAIQGAMPVAVDISRFLPFAFTAVFCMMTTTSTAISMEGKEFWVVKSLPIPTKTLLDSKILLNLSLMLPFYLISVIAMVIAVKMDWMQTVWLMLIPLSIMLFCVVFGITVNLKTHRFDWEKEEVIVKQSLSAAVGGFAGFFLSVALGAVVFLLPTAYQNAAQALICALVLGITACLYRCNNRAVLPDL